MQSVLPTHSGLSQQSVSIQDSLTGRIFLAIAATAFIATCAHISVPLPFTPVPITLQNFAVILVLLYLAEGAMGLPVFTPHSVGGVAHLLGPNGGYLFAYPIAAAVAGWVVRAMQHVTTRFRSALVASLAASLPIFVVGAAWLSHLLHLGITATWTLAVAPFLLGEIVKITALAGIFSTLQRWQRS